MSRFVVDYKSIVQSIELESAEEFDMGIESLSNARKVTLLLYSNNLLFNTNPDYLVVPEKGSNNRFF